LSYTGVTSKLFGFLAHPIDLVVYLMKVTVNFYLLTFQSLISLELSQGLKLDFTCSSDMIKCVIMVCVCVTVMHLMHWDWSVTAADECFSHTSTSL